MPVLAAITPVILLCALVSILIGLILCARRRRKFQRLSSQLDSSVWACTNRIVNSFPHGYPNCLFSPQLSYQEEDLIFKGRGNTITPTHQKLLESTFDSASFSDEWELPTKSVIIIERLGEGCFGEVFKGEINGFKNTHLISYQSRQDGSGRFVAIKVLKSN